MTAVETQNRVQRVVFVIYLVLIVSLAFMKPQVDTGFAALTPTDLIFPVLLACCLIGLATGSFALRSRRVFLPVLVYFLALLPSVLWSVNQSFSIRKLAGVAYLSLLAVLTANLVTSTSRLKWVAITWLLGSLAPILIALFGLVFSYIVPGAAFLTHITYHPGAVPVGSFPRLSATFLSASMFCNYLTVSFVLALIAMRAGWIPRIIGIALIALIALVTAFTVSIAIGGIFLAAGLWCLHVGSGKLIPSIAAIFAIVVAGLFLAIATIDLTTLATSAALASSSRILVWTDAMTTFLASPVTGKGLGTGAAAIRSINTDGTWSVLIDAHNTFLNVAAESGAVGLIGLIVLTVAVIRSAFLSTDPNRHLKSISFGLGIAFVSAFVYDGLTGSFEDTRHLWVLIGLIFATDSISRSGVRGEIQPL